ncbi:uncharacterized protein [Nicotiana sylvestris]|uniref:uncharacterized protein n=1 Tax=Nicotiana sylvestris TaxID=4096 RepID=UPI00388CA417
MGDPRVHLRTYCDKLVGVGKDEKIRIKLFMRSLKGDALFWYISQDPKKWTSLVGMTSDFMNRFRFNTENAPDVFYIQNLKKNHTETFREYATRWRSEAAKKFSNTIKLGERIEEGIKNGMVTNLEALQATNKALQSGGTSKKKYLYEKLKAAGYVSPIPSITLENPSQWVNPNKTCAYHSGIKGHTIDEFHSLKDKIQTVIDNKVIVAKDPALNVRNNPLPDHKGRDIHMIEIEDDWDPKGSIRLIAEGDEPKKPVVTLNPIVVQNHPSRGNEVNMSIPLEFEAPSSAKAPGPIKVEFGVPKAPAPFEVVVLPPRVPIPVAMSDITSFHSNSIPWDYTVEARRKGKTKTGEAIAAKGMTRTGRIYTPEHLAKSSKQASGRTIETGPDDLWRKIQAKETLGKILHEIKDGAINVKAFDGSQMSTIGEINLCLQMGPTWFDVDFQVIDVLASYNLLLGQPWIHVAEAVASTLHQVVKFEWNHQEDIATKWTDDCQKAFDRIKEYLSTPPVLVPPEPGRPLLFYLTVLDGAFGCVLGQHDETGRKEQAIYYLSFRHQVTVEISTIVRDNYLWNPKPTDDI